MDRIFACPASYARSKEFDAFVRSLDLPEMEEPEDSVAGTKLHAILEEVPFSSALLGNGAPEMSASKKLGQALSKLGVELPNDDFWFLTRCIEKRDHLINQKLLQARDQTGGFAITAIHLDSQRLALPSFSEFTGLADVLVLYKDGAGQSHAIVLDWKTGRKGHLYPDPTLNKQLMSLAVLVEQNYPEIQSVTIGLLHRENVRLETPTRVTRYSKKHLENARQMLEEKLQKAAELHNLVAPHLQSNGGDGKLPENVQRILEDESTTGDQCALCAGKSCCTKLAAEARAFARTLQESSLREVTKETIGNMNTEQFLAHLRQSAWINELVAPFSKVHKELEAVAKKLLEANRKLEGCSLKPGARTWTLRSKVEVEKPDGTKEVQERPLFPQDVFKQLLPLLGQTSYEDFLKTTCKVNAPDLRDLLMASLGTKKPADLEEKLREIFGENAILAVVPRAPSLIVDTSMVEQQQQETASAGVAA
jgi:hypothetical protein